MAGTIPAAAQPHPIVAPNQRAPFVDDRGYLTNIGISHLKQNNAFVTGMSRVIPCSCAGTSTAITLTPNPGGPLLQGYFDYEIFAFVASVTGDNAGWTASVITPTGALPALPTYHNSLAGPVILGSQDMIANNFYLYVYVDALNAGAGGFMRVAGGLL